MNAPDESIPFNSVELTFSKRLSREHAAGTTILSATIATLGSWAVEFYESEAALAQPLAEQPDLSDDKLCSVTFTLLFGEAVERLVCARLLLLSGHLSRAVASCRDSLEALQFAHIARAVPTQARRWMAGKKITAPKGVPLPPHVSNELRKSTAQVFNVYGTHPYREAVFLSLLAVPQGQSTAVQENIHHLVGETLGRVLATAGLAAAYCLDQFPKVQTPQALAAITAVESITHRLLGRRLDLRDPMRSGYQANF